ncbi:hypothetical protein BN130_2243 [Cronobacter malonaticus 507]|nr:hypothetical protein BN130_2243 [Cronobacter malonaticus 507]
MAVEVVGLRAGDAGRKRARHHRFRDKRRAEAVILTVRDGLHLHGEAFIAPGSADGSGNHHAPAEDIRDLAAGDFQLHPRRNRDAVGFRAQLRLAVQITLMAESGVERAAFRLTGAGSTRHQVIIRPVVGFAIRGGVAVRHVHAGVHVFSGGAVVVVTGEYRFFHHPVMVLHCPHGFDALIVHSGGRHGWQLQALPVMTLVVVKLHHVNVQAGVGRKAKPDTHFCQQARNKGQVILAILHHLFATRVLIRQSEDKVLAAHVVALAQDFLDNLRHRHVLVDTVLVAAREQRQPRLQGQFVAAFIP